jgi:hypothetical protein
VKENLNIDAKFVVMETGEFIDEGQPMAAWTASTCWVGAPTIMHITNFLDFHFSRNQLQFGNGLPRNLRRFWNRLPPMVDPV